MLKKNKKGIPNIEKTESIILDISKMNFNNMEIMFGPKSDDGDKAICKSLVEKYLPNVHVVYKKSRLNNKIRI